MAGYDVERTAAAAVLAVAQNRAGDLAFLINDDDDARVVWTLAYWLLDDIGAKWPGGVAEFARYALEGMREGEGSS